MEVLQRHTGKILGPSGGVIKEMQARFGCKLNIVVSEAAKGGALDAINKLKMTGEFIIF